MEVTPVSLSRCGKEFIISPRITPCAKMIVSQRSIFFFKPDNFL
ncbi:Uncharacterised protein [Klebsiella pneumoniae]|nr:Uncharacterised protein [Klebsiella pneumoniae]